MRLRSHFWDARLCGNASAPLPAALVRRGDRRLLHRPGRQRPGARLRLFRGGAGTALGGAAAHPDEARRIAANIAKAPETTSGLLWPGAGPSTAKGYPLS